MCGRFSYYLPLTFPLILSTHRWYVYHSQIGGALLFYQHYLNIYQHYINIICLPTLPSGKLTKSYWSWPIEIADLPIQNGGSFHSNVKLPEGTMKNYWSMNSSISIYSHLLYMKLIQHFLLFSSYHPGPGSKATKGMRIAILTPFKNVNKIYRLLNGINPGYTACI